MAHRTHPRANSLRTRALCLLVVGCCAFAWVRPSPGGEEAAAPTTIRFTALDTDSDGRIDTQEWQAFHRRTDRNADGAIDETEWRTGLARAARADPAPAPGERVPALRAERLDGGPAVDLSTLGRTTVLVFGNWTCGIFTDKAPALAALHRRFGETADFLLVYTREAHPSDGGRPSGTVRLPQTRTLPERRAAATLCVSALRLTMPILLDDLDDRLAGAFDALPHRVFVLTPGGRVAWRSAKGPRGLDLAALERALERLARPEGGDGRGVGPEPGQR